MGERGVFDSRGFDAIGQRRIDGDPAVGREFSETLREIAIVRGKGGTDFALGNVLVKAAAQRAVGDGDRIVRSGSLIRTGATMNGEDCGRCEDRDARKSKEWMLRDANDSHLLSPDLGRAASAHRVQGRNLPSWLFSSEFNFP